MNSTTFLSSFFIFTGFIFIFISIFKFREIVFEAKKLLMDSKKVIHLLHQKYRLLLIFFAFGYAFVFFLTFNHFHIFGELLVGFIFFCGGIFVFISNLLQKQVLISIKKRHDELIQKNIQLEQLKDVTIYALAYQAEMRDLDTGLHLERTAKYVKIIAEELSRKNVYKSILTRDYIKDLVKASPLHDIGKVGVPDHILKKPGKLTHDEFEIMKKHSEYGAAILRRAVKKLKFETFLSLAIELVEYHHEKWDGTGYPEGLKGNMIPLAARIMALADVYDAMRSMRCYKEPYSHEKTSEIIKQQKGIHFDPDIVEIFIDKELEFEKISKELSDF